MDLERAALVHVLDLCPSFCGLTSSGVLDVLQSASVSFFLLKYATVLARRCFFGMLSSMVIVIVLDFSNPTFMVNEETYPPKVFVRTRDANSFDKKHQAALTVSLRELSRVPGRG